MPSTIPILDLTRQFQKLKPEIDQALCAVAEGGQYILGPNVKAFEAEIAQFIGVKHVIGCANGSDALYLALLALKLPEQAEVITTPFTYIATSEAIIRAGLKPVFVDIDPQTFNLNISQIESVITPKTKAILPVHLYGQSCDMAALMAVDKKHSLAVIEDCAQSIGATFEGKQTGTFGDVGCFSFFPSKNLGAMGDGGMLTTNDDTLAERLRMLRVHGSRERYLHEDSGINSRLDEMQAAVLRIKLKYLADWNEGRRQVATRYNKLLKPLADAGLVQTPFVPEKMTPVFHQYTIVLKQANGEQRNALQKQMTEAGVQTMIYYPIPQFHQPSHAFLGLNPADFPVSEELSGKVLSLPMFPELTEAEQQRVVDALSVALNKVPAAV